MAGSRTPLLNNCVLLVISWATLQMSTQLDCISGVYGESPAWVFLILLVKAFGACIRCSVAHLEGQGARLHANTISDRFQRCPREGIPHHQMVLSDDTSTEYDWLHSGRRLRMHVQHTQAQSNKQ